MYDKNKKIIKNLLVVCLLFILLGISAQEYTIREKQDNSGDIIFTGKKKTLIYREDSVISFCVDSMDPVYYYIYGIDNYGAPDSLINGCYYEYYYASTVKNDSIDFDRFIKNHVIITHQIFKENDVWWIRFNSNNRIIYRNE